MKNVESSFLKDKYWAKKEFREAVEKSANQIKRMTEEDDFQISQKPEGQIPYYLERLEKISGRIDPRTGERGKLFLETSLYPKYVIKPENISDEYIKGILLGNFAESRGYERDALKNEELKQQLLVQFKQETQQDFASYQIPAAERERMQSMVITDQKIRLKTWFDYLTGEETRQVPAAFRYWVLAEMLKLGSFDEGRKVFNRRTENTAASFPELDQQALARVLDEVQRKRQGEPLQLQVGDVASQAKFEKFLQNEDFGKLYAFALEYVNSLRLPSERLMITKGEWRQFSKGTPASELTQTLEGFNTKWCIAGQGFAEDYLSRSDLWIYYSEDQDGSASIPRACIVDSKEQGITEVRGILSNENAKQHLDSYITPLVADKLKTFSSGEKWQSTMADMKQLSRIYFKHLQNESLDKEDLVFLYEIDKPFRGSGYNDDPRIEEIRKRRNPDQDMPIIFECESRQIAHTPAEIKPDTKAYVGQLEKDIFKFLPETVEYVFTKFPEEKISFKRITFGSGPKDVAGFEKEITADGHQISDWAKDIMKKVNWQDLKEPKEVELVILNVASLGFKQVAARQKIYDRALELGLELCPAVTGLELRRQYQKENQPKKEYLLVGMEPITDSAGDLKVFLVNRSRDGESWLDSSYGHSDSKWSPGSRWVFVRRKRNLET
ncbi:MAG: hypothetical protein ABIJ81_02725 [Patescibacteria group bacterium]